MPIVVCPKCQVSLQKGGWEVMSHCPVCNAQWSDETNVDQRRTEKVCARACLYTVLAFIPFLGLFFGVLGAFYGYLAVRMQRFVLGSVAMILGMIVGFVVQPLALYWGYGLYSDHGCVQSLKQVSAAIATYRQDYQAYPANLAELAERVKGMPVNCPGSGGAYFYFRPGTAVKVMKKRAVVAQTSAPSSTSVPASGPASMPATAAAPEFDEIILQPLPRATLAGDSQTLMITEVASSHRHVRLCIMSDLSVQTLSHEQFYELLQQPQNIHFAKAYDRAVKVAAGQIKKPEKKPALQATSATSPASGPSSQASRPASEPEAASGPTQGK
jgi:hypothetical protein